MADENNSGTLELRGINFFDFLPTELITLILTDGELCFSDVVHFGATCKRYQTLTNDNELWKSKLLNRWTFLHKHVSHTSTPVTNWLNQCKKMHGLPHSLHGVLRGLSAKCYHKEEVTYAHFKLLKAMYLSDRLCQGLVDATLMAIVNDKEIHKDLTQKYYAQKALRYVRHMLLRQEWKAFLALPIQQQSLLEGAILFERWHNLSASSPQDNIRQGVNEIANQARRKLKHGHPSYHGNIEGVVEMTPEQCYEVLDAVNDVIFKEMSFHGNTDDYYNEYNSFMSMVLTRKLGIPITLCILYEAVIRKLGIVLRPVNFPGHFILRWNYSSDGFKELDTNLFIDAFEKGKVLTSAEVYMNRGVLNAYGYHKDGLLPCTPRDVFRRMTANVMHLRDSSMIQSHSSNADGIELLSVLHPESFEAVVGCVKYYVEQRINYTESLQMLLDVQAKTDMEATGVSMFRDMIHEVMEQDGPEDKEPPAPKPKRRKDNQEVAYAVGMVMKHRRYNYICVIYGWDPVCKLSTQWQRQMGVHRLPHKDQQPFYNVLVEDTSNRYAAQESLDYIDVPVAVTHPEVGRYFQEFTKTCYLPNEQLSERYPDDPVITVQKASELYPV